MRQFILLGRSLMRTKYLTLNLLCGSLLGLLSFVFPWLILIWALVAAILWLLNRFSPPEHKRFLVALFITGLTVRIILACALHAISYGTHALRPSAKYTNPGETVLMGDAAGYSAYGWLLTQYWKGDRSVFSEDKQVALGKYFFTAQTYLAAFFYLIFGYYPLLPALFNSLIGSLIAIFVFLIAREYLDEETARISSFLTMFWPSILFWSLGNTREPISILSLVVTIWSVLGLYRIPKPHYFAIAGISLWVFYNYQQSLFIFLAAWIALVLFIKVFSVKLLRRFLLLLLIFGIGTAFATPKITVWANKATSTAVAMVDGIVSRNLGAYFTGGSTYKIYPERLYDLGIYRQGKFFNHLNLFDWAVTIGKGFVYFFFLPFPLFIRSNIQLLCLPETLFWYALFPFFALGLLLSLRYFFKKTFMISLLLVPLTLVYSLTEANMGTAFRHKSLIFTLYLIFASFAIRKFFLRGNNIKQNTEKGAFNNGQV